MRNKPLGCLLWKNCQNLELREVSKAAKYAVHMLPVFESYDYKASSYMLWISWSSLGCVIIQLGICLFKWKTRMCHRFIKRSDLMSFKSAFSKKLCANVPCLRLRHVLWCLWVDDKECLCENITLSLGYVMLVFYKTTVLVFPFAACTSWLGRNTSAPKSTELFKNK